MTTQTITNATAHNLHFQAAQTTASAPMVPLATTANAHILTVPLQVQKETCVQRGASAKAMNATLATAPAANFSASISPQQAILANVTASANTDARYERVEVKL